MIRTIQRTRDVDFNFHVHGRTFTLICRNNLDSQGVKLTVKEWLQGGDGQELVDVDIQEDGTLVVKGGQHG